MLSDAFVEPPVIKQMHVEELVRLPDSFLHYTPSPETGPVQLLYLIDSSLLAASTILQRKCSIHVNLIDYRILYVYANEYECNFAALSRVQPPFFSFCTNQHLRAYEISRIQHASKLI